MNRKSLFTPIAIVVMLSASAATVFASGGKDERSGDDYGPQNGRGGYNRMAEDGDRRGGRPMENPRNDRRGDFREAPEMETSIYEGELSLNDGSLPELVTASGERYSLIVPFPITAEDLPGNGDAISVEAVESSRTRRDWSGVDKYLMVVSAEINGVELEPDWPENFRGGRPGGGFHPGMQGGFGGPGMMGHPEMFGGDGAYGNPWESTDDGR